MKETNSEILGRAKEVLERIEGVYAPCVTREAYASTLMRSAIRNMARLLHEAGASLKDVGCSIERLKQLLAPEPRLSLEEVNELWEWVIRGGKGEELSAIPELRDE